MQNSNTIYTKLYINLYLIIFPVFLTFKIPSTKIPVSGAPIKIHLIYSIQQLSAINYINDLLQILI